MYVQCIKENANKTSVINGVNYSDNYKVQFLIEIYAIGSKNIIMIGVGPLSIGFRASPSSGSAGKIGCGQSHAMFRFLSSGIPTR